MTDLSKGIIEIDGFEISSRTTSSDIIENLKNLNANRVMSKSGNVEIFTFKNVELLNGRFNVDATFIGKKIKHIKLFSHYDTNLSYEERFESDCKWLKSVLGEPHDVLTHTNSYYFNGLHIYSFIERDFSRNPADTHICCSYEG